MRALYLCYFGLREPLVQTQVLPYLRELVRGGARMSLLTFEPESDRPWEEERRERLRAEGIEWHVRRYHKRPTLPATLFDLFAGAWTAVRIVRRGRIDVLHARSHVGAAIGALAKKVTNARLIFDIRGFLPEEYVDSGNWAAGGVLFRATKAAERRLFASADGFVVLTERARETLFPRSSVKPVEVIPCCVSAERCAPRTDREAVRRELGVSDRDVFVYAGVLGGYYLTRETAELLAAARERDPRVYALVLTQGPAAPMIAELQRAGFTASDYRVMRATPEEMPRLLGAADVGLSLIRPSYARIAQSPTKFAEYLAAGLPAIATSGIGDLDAHIEEGRVGVVLRTLDRDAYATALDALELLRLDPDLGDRCRGLARERFDVETVGGARYRRLYDAVIRRRRTRVLALASYPVEAASSRFRVTQFIAPLAERGIDVMFSPFLDASLFADLYEPRRLLRRLPRLAMAALRRLGSIARAARTDVIFVQREAMLFGPPLIEWIAARVLRRRMILDLDDATYLSYSSPVYGRLATRLKWPGKVDRLIRWSTVVTCGNETIAAYVRSRGTQAIVVPTVVDLRVFHPRARALNDVPVIGWIGTHTTYPFLELLMPMLDRLAQEHAFRLTVIGSGRAGIDARPWRMESEPDDIRSFDIGLYPLIDDTWSAGKSALKAVQYMASGVPFVMSPVGVCATMGVSGETHFLARSDDEWAAALGRLLTDAELRARMGRAGRRWAEERYSLEAVADTLAEVFAETAL
jgi:glycosyltransferase involved in cell wall biosynthesis